MRLRTFTAPNMAEAMAKVRAQLGGDAIIISTRTADDGGCMVTAATDAPELEPLFEAERHAWAVGERDGYLRQVLTAHGLPPHLVDRISRDAADVQNDDPAMALAGAIDARHRFEPLSKKGQKAPIVLVGIPGSGKTVTAAKIAARGHLDKLRVAVATADTRRAGGVEQLSAFTRILGLDLIVAKTAAELAEKLPAERDLAVVDTPGTNPFDADEMQEIVDIVGGCKGEPVLVMPAGGDAMESADVAAAFADIGAKRMIVTRIDLTRRLGGLLAAAGAGKLSFAGVSVDPYVAEGLTPINPVSLARLLVPEEPAPAEIPPLKAEGRR